MSFWQYTACVAGYAAAHSTERDTTLSDSEIDALGDFIDAKD